MFIEKELIKMTDPGLPIKTYIVNSKNQNLAAKAHIHNEIELIYILEGCMVFQVANNTLNINSGQIIFINSLTVHSSKTIPSVFTKMCLLQFDPGLIYNTDIASEYKYLTPFIYNDTLKYCLFNNTNQSETHQLMSALLMEIATEFLHKDTAYEILIKSNLYKLLTILYRNGILKYNLVNNIKRQKILFNKISKVLDYVEKNYTEYISLDMMSNKLGLNYHYFCRLFKIATGKPFVQYLNYVRVSAAEKLLLTTDKTITEIMMDTGFSSLSYFNRVFKKHKGCSPTIYRKMLIP